MVRMLRAQHILWIALCLTCCNEGSERTSEKTNLIQSPEPKAPIPTSPIEPEKNPNTTPEIINTPVDDDTPTQACDGPLCPDDEAQGRTALQPCFPGQIECAEGLACPPSIGRCMMPCRNQSDCYPQHLCERDPDTESGWCMPTTALRNTSCLHNGLACAPGAGSCEAVGMLEHACTVTCPSNAIDHHDACSFNGRCFAAPMVHVDEQHATCDPQALDPCPSGMRCVPADPHTYRCVQAKGWCEQTPPMLGQINDAGLARHIALGNSCDPEAETPCALRGTPSATPAHAQCMQLTSGTLPVCVGLCGDGDDNFLDCGIGYRCVAPTQPYTPLFNIQKNADRKPVVCDPRHEFPCGSTFSGIQCTGPFEDSKHYCATPMPICVLAL